ncbi:MAG: PASTA domain-containing protein [Chloroflexi bacterium]|nr:PASTA domain-containing protein [Chloroflexota bacterium]
MVGRGDGYLTGIGEELRQARIRRGRSIAQAHQATRIARHYLEALEAEDWRRMPAAPFARGFLSSYAQYLGLDEGPLLDRFPFEPSAPGEGLQLSDETIESYQSVERSGTPREDLGPWLVAAVVVLVIIGAVVAVVSLREEALPVEETRDVPGIDTVAETLDQTNAPQINTNADFQALPDLRQFTSREAVSYIKLLNAPYVVVSIYDDSPVGTVLEQSPAPGANPPEDAVITLVVSRGPRPGASTDTGSGGG